MELARFGNQMKYVRGFQSKQLSVICQRDTHLKKQVGGRNEEDDTFAFGQLSLRCTWDVQ